MALQEIHKRVKTQLAIAWQMLSLFFHFCKNNISIEDEKKARQMFFDFSCNAFYMWNDGVLKEYQKFHVSHAKEKQWRSEYITDWVGKLSVDDLTAVNKLRDAWAVEALENLISMADRGDGYAKLEFANTIWDMANRSRPPAHLRTLARQTAVNLWQSLIQTKVEITEAHIPQISPYMHALNASTPEEYVKNYARSRLKEVKFSKF